jgi:hypothetical protein
MVLGIQGSYRKMAAFATSVQKISPIWWINRPHPPKNTIKKLKNEYKFKKNTARPPLKICESVTLTKFFFYLVLTKPKQNLTFIKLVINNE